MVKIISILFSYAVGIVYLSYVGFMSLFGAIGDIVANYSSFRVSFALIVLTFAFFLKSIIGHKQS